MQTSSANSCISICYSSWEELAGEQSQRLLILSARPLFVSGSGFASCGRFVFFVFFFFLVLLKTC